MDRLESWSRLLAGTGTSAGRHLGPWRLGLLLALAATLGAQPVVHSEPQHGVLRAVAYHAASNRPVTDADPALPGETLLVDVHGATAPIEVLVGGSEVPGRLRISWSPPRARRSRSSRLRVLSATTAWEGGRQQVAFTVPTDAGGSFVELTLVSGGVRGNTATISVRPAQADPSQLTAADVAGLIERAATAIDDPAMAIAVTDRAGGVPVFKNLPDGSGQPLVGGLGVAGIDPDAAEFAAVAATFGTEFFVALPLPPPGAVYVDGIRLPFVEQTTRPEGTGAASVPAGEYIVEPKAGAGVPVGYLIAPRGSPTLSAAEVDQIITAARDRAERTRAVIRLPLGSRSRMAISVGDLEGNILGLFRMPDATVFSIDVAATKARNAVYFSSEERVPDDLPGVPAGTAVTARTIGFGSQSFFPSGIDGSTPGPFRELFLFDLANPCTQGREPVGPNQSGIVFFPGSSPLYKNGRLVGGLGVSGDGVEQDDYVSAGGAEQFQPPPEQRADRVFIDGVRLPYWRFPRNPEQ